MITVEEALKIMENKNKKRFPHILGTYNMAQKLARKYNLDEYKVSIAAILHDYAKNEPIDKMQEIIKKYLDKSILKYSPVIYHGEVGSFLIQKDLGISDKDIILAVKYHVTGHPQMNDIAKSIYIADFIEETRRHSGVEFCRKLSNISLDIGVLAVSEKIYNYLSQKNNQDIHPLTERTYFHFLKKVGVKKYETIKSNYQSM